MYLDFKFFLDDFDRTFLHMIGYPEKNARIREKHLNFTSRYTAFNGNSEQTEIFVLKT